MTWRLTKDRARSPGEVTFEGPVLVLTEGEDDALLILEVAKAYGIGGVQAHVMNGKDTGWGSKLRFIAKHPSFRINARAIGLVRDADDDARAALQSCQDALRKGEMEPPAGSGEVVSVRGKRVGIFVVPGGDSVGSIEDLVLLAAEEERLDCVGVYSGCLRAKGIEEPENKSKGRMQAYLAGLPPSPKTLAVATVKGLFDWNAHAFRPLADWLGELADNAQE